MTTRRQFLGTAAALAAPGIFVKALSAQTAESRIEVLLDEPIGTIAPEIYGHFVEHLGGVVYDGIWVGERSKVPNIGGLRKELVEALRAIKPAVIRWPGGCFADQYDWRDGVGPRDKRPTRTNFWMEASEWPAGARKDGAASYEPNQFGTLEFARFCKLAGAQPYFAANLRSLPAQEFWHWVEYCNAPAGTTTLAEQRASDGEREALGVRYWGVGNESWGCGGNFTPEDYATEFLRYTAWVPGYGVGPRLVASGPSDSETDWTRGFLRKVAGKDLLQRVFALALHHYSWNVSGGRTNDWAKGKGDALKFGAEEYYELVRHGEVMDSLIQAHWDVMGEFDRRHGVRLAVDEWGAWYAPGTPPFSAALLGQQSTMRDAVLASSTLDTFHRHADKVAMANVAQLDNCLQSLFLAHEDKFCVTPTYHVFAMYAAHQGAQSLRTVLSAPSVRYSRNSQAATLAGLSGSASIVGKRLTLTVTNPSLDQTREAEIVLRGAPIANVRVITLAANDVHAHNTFEDPKAVEPREAALAAKGPLLVHRFPPASVTKIELDLA
jgi:alpha-N-arabinofuranosidase